MLEQYKINKSDSLQRLLERSDLVSLPIQTWYEIFKEKDGAVFFEILYKVLETKI